MALDVGQASGPARPWRGDLGQAFGEDPARAPAGRTAEPSRLDAQGDDTSLPGQISQSTLVAAVHPGGGHPTERADGGRRLRAAKNDNAVRVREYLLNKQALGDQRR